MSRYEFRENGSNQQGEFGNPLPFSAEKNPKSHKNKETLSDVGLRADSGPNEGHSEAVLRGSQGDSDRAGEAHNERSADRHRSAGTSTGFDRADESSEKPPTSNNMGGANRQKGQKAGGIDTLEVSIYGQWQNWAETRSRLEEAREAAERSDGLGGIDLVAGERAGVRASGARHGVYCRYVVEWRGCTLAIVDRGKWSKKFLSVHLRIGSARLMDVGHVVAWESVVALLGNLGFVFIRNVVGRVDLCTDHGGQSMAVVQQAVTDRRIVCRARKRRLFHNGETLETLTVGCGDVVLRIYNKAVECIHDAMKYALLVERRWGVACRDAVRVEFQLRRGALQTHFNVKTVEELFASLGTIVGWCVDDWFRITGEIDRKNGNQRRASASRWWSEVREAFRSWAGSSGDRVPGSKGLVPDIRGLEQQAIGCLTTIVAHFEEVAEGDWVGFVKKWQALSTRYRLEILEQIKTKRSELVMRYGTLGKEAA